jgi:hypothetical protein
LQSVHIPHIPHIPPAPILFILSCTGHPVLALLVSAMGICWGKGHILSTQKNLIFQFKGRQASEVLC